MAGDATWRVSPATSSFDDAANWSGGSVPTGIATFGASNTTTVAVGSPTTLGALFFAAAAPAYTLNVTANVTLNGDGIVSSSANAPTINVTGGATLATTSTSGNVHVNLNGGGLEFGENSSNAGLALSIGANGGTLDTNGNSVTLSSAINGIGGLVKQGSGTLRLTGSNSYAGGTTVSDGVLDGTAGGIQGNIVNNATVSLTSGDGTYSGVMSGTGKLIVSNNQSLVLTGSNTYSGGTVISGGSPFTFPTAVTFSTASNFGTGPITLTDSGTLIWAAGSTVDISSRLAPLEGAGRLIVNGNNVTLASTISGSGVLRLENSGILTLAAANTYGGGTIISSFATLVVSSDANLGAAAGALFITNSTLRTTASFSSARNIGLGERYPNGYSILETDAGTTLTLTGTISFSPNGAVLKKAGAGTLLLAGDNDFEAGGGVIVAAGTLKLGHAASFAGLSLESGTVDLNGYAASVRSFGSTGGTVNGGTLIVRGGDVVSLAGTAALAVQGDVRLRPSNSYSGGTTVQSGSLTISADSALGAAGTGLAIDNFSILSTTGSFSTGRGTTLGGGGGIFAPIAGTTLALAGAVGGSGTLQLAGPGTLVLAGTNSYAGGTAITGGTLQVGNGGTSGTLGTGLIVDNSILSINRSDAFSLGAVSGSGKLMQIGIGTTTLTGAMSYTGGTTVSAGTLKLGAGGSLAAGSALTLDGGSFTGATFDIGANSQTLGSVSGTGGSLVLGGGTLSDPSGLTLASANLLFGGFGLVQATVDGAGRLIATGGTLEFTAAVDGSIASDIRVGAAAGSVLKFNSTVGSMTVHPTVTFNGGAGLLDLSSTTLSNFHGVLSGFAVGEGIRIANAASAELDGTGKTLTVYDSLHSSLGALTFGNSYSGYAFAVTNSTVRISPMANDATWLTSPATSSFDDAGNWSGGSVPTGVATFGASNTTTVAVASPTTLGALLFATAAPAYTLNVSANVTLNGDGIVSSSANAPTINVTGGATFATTSIDGDVHVNLNGGGLRFGGNSDNPGLSVALGANGGTLDTNGNLVTVSSAINGIGGLVKQGSGTLRLTGSNTYVGGTTVSAGVLEGTTAGIQGSIVNYATVSFTGGLQGPFGTYSGVMSGTGKLVIGNYALTLGGNNTYSGGTTINSSSSVTFTAASNFGTGAITLNGGQLVWASGNTADISSRLAPLGPNGGQLYTNRNNVTLATAISGSGGLSKNGEGTLTLTAANSYSGGTTISGGYGIPSVLAVSSDANLGATGGGLTIDSATLETKASFSSARNITLKQSNIDVVSKIETDAGTTLTLTGRISSDSEFVSCKLTKTGAGTLFLVGDTDIGDYGVTTVAAGTLKLGSSASLGRLSLSNSTLDLNGNAARVTAFGSTGGTVNGGMLTVDTTAFNPTIAGPLVGTAGLVVQGTGKLTLSGANGYSGGTTLQSGTLSLSSDAALGASGSGLTINNFATLAIGTSFSTNRAVALGGTGGLFAPIAGTALTLTGTVSGNGTLQLAGPGTLVLAGSNSYTGGTAVSAGTLQVGNGGTSGTLGTGPVVDNGVLSINRSDAFSLGAVSGSGKLMQIGIGTTTLTGAMTYTGGTTVSAGTLKLGAGASLASGSALTLDGGSFSGATFDIGANSRTLGSVSGTGGSLLLGGGTLSDPSGLTLASANLLLGGYGLVQATIDGAGRLIATGGKLEFAGAVDASIASDIRVGSAAGSVLKFNSTVGSMTVHPTVTFNGGAGLLDLSSTTLASFHGVLSGFAAGEGIRIANAASAALDGTGKILTVYDSLHSSLGALTFGNSYSGYSFTVTNNTVSVSSAGVDYSAATGGVYTDLIAQFTKHAPAGQGWSSSVTAISTDQLSGVQNVTGSSFADVLVGGPLNSTLAGGAGNDIYYVHNTGDQVIEAAGGGSDNVYASVDYALGAGQEVEVLRAYSPSGLTLTGNELANTLVGGTANDTLNGGGGNDTLFGDLGADVMAGGSGNDIYYVDNAGDQVIEAAGGGTDNVYASVNYALGAGQEVEVLRVYGSVALTLTGNELANTLIGGTANDTLNGGFGADTMAGGSGNDFYYVDNAGDQVIEAAGGGSDNVYASVNYVLGAGQEVEVLRVYSLSGLTLTGNELANTLVGGTANDTLNGGGGNDTLFGDLGADVMVGGSGNDIYYVDNAGDQVVEAAGGGTDNLYASINYTLGAGQDVEVLRVYSSAGLTLTGNELANTLVGASGNDTLNGGLGADVMAGGSGNDFYYVDNAGDQVIEAAGGGTDNVYASVNYVLGAGQEVEVLRVYSLSGLTLTGNELANTLVGGTANDTLNGGGGNDTLFGDLGADVMAGGSGNDIYYVDNAGDQVIEAAGGGSDNVYASVNYTLVAGQEVEVLRVYSSAGLTLTGNELANTLVGASGNDTLNGGGGNDTLFGDLGADVMSGGSGNDTYYVDNAGDQVIEAAGGGTDNIYSTVSWSMAAGQEIESLRAYGAGATSGVTLIGNELNNALVGGSGNDVLNGDAGNDVLNGDAGNDTLVGGAGNDVFRFSTTLGSNNVNTISDFNASGDSMQLDHAAFAGLAIGLLSASAFALDSATGAGPQIVYNHVTGALLFDSNGAGAGGATQFASLTGAPSLNASYFSVI